MGHYNLQCHHDLDIGTNCHPLNMHPSNPLPLHCQKTLCIHGRGPPSHHCHTLSDEFVTLQVNIFIFYLVDVSLQCVT